MPFIRPLLEYSCVVWDSFTVADADRLEQLQLKAARIVCILYMQKPNGENLIRDAKSENCHFFLIYICS